MKVGDSWKLKDKITATTADVLPIWGIGERSYTLEMTVTRDVKKLVGCFVVFAVLLSFGVGIFPNVAAADGELLYYKPQLQALKYDLSIATKSQALALFGPGPQEEHEDIMSLSQKVENAGDGLLDIALTVREINQQEQGPKTTTELHLNPRGGL